MPKYTELAGTAGETVIGALETAQDAAVTAVSTAISTVGGVIPSGSTKIKLPESVPTAADVAETTFDLIERVVASQKKYTLGLIGAFKPLTEKVRTNGTTKAAK
jgi:hypothetical protein